MLLYVPFTLFKLYNNDVFKLNETPTHILGQKNEFIKMSKVFIPQNIGENMTKFSYLWLMF